MNQIVLVGSSTNVTSDPEMSLQRTMRRSHLSIALLTLGFGGALALIPIASAVIAGGEVSVASRTKKIAHPRGGVIVEVPISNGDRVSEGQILMRFDTNVSAASAAMTVESIDQLRAREARLQAERDGRGTIAFPATLTSRLSVSEVAKSVREEKRIFSLNREAMAGQRATLGQQIRQAEQVIRGYNVQADVYRKQEALIAEEQVANDQLWEKRYTTLQRRNELNRAAVGLRGNAASAETSVAQTNARIAELRERMYVLEDNARKEAGAELANVQTKLIELRQNNVVAQDTNMRNSVRAPYSGIVDKLSFTTIGGVVPAGETIMEIVPDRDPLIVTARVSPADIDQLRAGHYVSLRFSAFNMQTTPQIAGKLTKISADRTIDTQLGVAYFPIEVTISKAEIAKLGGLKLRPGMPVEAFIQTGERTLLAYLFKPLSDQIARAFR
jgi:HlyD family secretion protein